MISPVNHSIVLEEEMKFENKAELLRTFYNTFEGKRILIGLVQNNQIFLLDQKQDRKEDIVLHKEDSFIYLKYTNEEPIEETK